MEYVVLILAWLQYIFSRYALSLLSLLTMDQATIRANVRENLRIIYQLESLHDGTGDIAR